MEQRIPKSLWTITRIFTDSTQTVHCSLRWCCTVSTFRHIHCLNNVRADYCHLFLGSWVFDPALGKHFTGRTWICPLPHTQNAWKETIHERNVALQYEHIRFATLTNPTYLFMQTCAVTLRHMSNPFKNSSTSFRADGCTAVFQNASRTLFIGCSNPKVSSNCDYMKSDWRTSVKATPSANDVIPTLELRWAAN